ncbi:hypothetical protein C8Q70DRAFT_917632 [Cubamyces menziesii]|uniref:Uncharacterized protein n=1 Tax=Trametes cubensis TaxID=1111947 RepID=A0AAD7X982_9APHY|nr:hypothetical protein C8Q70DRAFT_917632 [Cubamyces menziesii]KAJ8472513.1 hypothetical protein ONZ51_g8460 [Trametes cubensis]
MSSGAMQSNVGNPQIYEDGDQRNGPVDTGLSQERPAGEGQRNAHNIFDPKDDRKLDVRMQQEKKMEREAEQEERAQTITNPLEPAKRHGHEPSRGAQIDAELQREDEENVRKKGPYNGTSH